MLGLLLLIVPVEAHPTDRVDMLEVNHFHDCCGTPIFTQLIAWDFDYRNCRFQVRAWRMIRDGKPKVQIDHDREDAFALWNDNGTLREVRAPVLRETWTQEDPELWDRELWPRELRRELSP